MNQTEPDQSDKVFAALALTLAAGGGRGPVPSELEIEGLRSGWLAGSKRSRLLARLARDPLAFGRLRELERGAGTLSRLWRQESGERAAAALALSLEQGREAMGERPELLELELWRSGHLASQRAAQVLVWVTRDASLAAQLKELEGAEGQRRVLEREAALSETSQAEQTGRAGQSVAAPPGVHGVHARQRLTDWLTGRWEWFLGGGFAAAAVALLLLALLPGLLHPPQPGPEIDALYSEWEGRYLPDTAAWPWREDFAAKAMNLWPRPAVGEVTPTLRAFRAGVRSGLHRLVGQDPAWRPSLEALPAAAPACAAGDIPCASEMDLHEAAGRWAVVVYWRCRGGQHGMVSDPAPVQAGEHLRTALEGLTPRSFLLPVLRRWQQAGGEARGMCEAAEGMLEAGLAD